MREDELFWAYRMSPLPTVPEISEEQRRENVARTIEATRRLGYRKCQRPGCITLIALGAERTICRFHLRG